MDMSYDMAQDLYITQDLLTEMVCTQSSPPPPSLPGISPGPGIPMDMSYDVAQDLYITQDLLTEMVCTQPTPSPVVSPTPSGMPPPWYPYGHVV